MEKHPQSEENFVPPRHWVSVGELSADYWNDPKAQERRGQEFHDKPIETLEAIEKTGKLELARRDFLTIMGASMAMATAACARRPVHKIIPYVVKPEEITPGEANFYASTDPETGLGVVIKTREGRPIKLEGNVDHPMSGGALSSRGHAALLNLYDTARLKNPVSRTRADGGSKAITWSDADIAILSRLKKLAANGGRVRVLTGEVKSPTTRRLIGEFLANFKTGAHVEFEALTLDEVIEGQELCYGAAVLPHYDFTKAAMVLSLGADFLGTWPDAVEYGRAWASNRKLSAKNADLSKLVTVESMMTLTGANSDERYAVRPGDELKMALAIANALGEQGASLGEAQASVATYKPEVVAAEIGIEGGAAKIRKIAAGLWKSRGKSLVVAGGLNARTDDTLALQVAANFLNSLLGNEGVTVDGTRATQDRRTGFAAVSKLMQDMRAGQVDLLLVWGTNPAYVLPKAAGWADAVEKVPFVVSMADREDETAQAADLVLPDHHWLENWGDGQPRKTIYSLQQPVIAPMHDTRAFQDTLIAWIKGATLKGSGITTRSANWHEYLKGSWQELASREWGVSAASFERFWEKSLKDGVISSEKNGVASARAFRGASTAKLPKYAASATGMSLVMYPTVPMGDGRHANNAWLQEVPEPISSVAWDAFISIGPAIAKQLGLRSPEEHPQDEVIEVSGEGFKFELPAVIQPGLHPQVVAVPVGYGRTNVGQVGDGVGVNAFAHAKVAQGQWIFAGMAVKLRKTGKYYKLARTQMHNATENRPIINDLSLAEYLKNPGTSNHTNPHMRMETVPSIWPMHDYSKGYQWGMAIDLNSCTGCGACIVACQAENNIPVVGRDNVRMSREMHWIRIDRYYSGSAENPSVVFQPMMCQHCENAPCETVCPVLATVHSSEGLNEQIYNRCVGTRYCQNNCPYKVRRFNFFDHWKNYEGTMNMAWNPEVTVRSRGIMEKCTFCVQRIRDAKDHSVLKGKHIQDGELKTACQQTCPTEAITFGNVNDKYSQVTKLREHPRAYRVLEVLNTRPRISYMSKVRNIEVAANQGADAGHGKSHETAPGAHH